MKKSVIVYGKRTALGRLGGALKDCPATQLGARLVENARENLGSAAATVDEIILGHVLTAGCGQSPAKQAALAGGLSPSVCATTINRVCGSGMKAVIMAQEAIALGKANCVFAGGQENMSLAPHLLMKSRQGYKYGSVTMLDHMAHDGLTNPYDQKAMGCFADLCATEYKISREEQDTYAQESYLRAQENSENGHFAKEITPLTLKTRKAEVQMAKDEEPFAAKLDKMPSLRPAFSPDGTVTAANASSINDGAALLVVMEESYAKKMGCEILAEVVATDAFSHEPQWFTTAPVQSMKRALASSSLKVSDIAQFEINEAFSVVPLVAMKELGLKRELVNPYGGSVALGHPIGASGARILVSLLNGLAQKQSGSYGLASICIGGGEANTMILRKP